MRSATTIGIARMAGRLRGVNATHRDSQHAPPYVINDLSQ